MTAMIDHVPNPGAAVLPDRKQMTRVTAGIAISLAVHALLLSSYRRPQAPALPPRASEPLTVRLRAAPAPPPVVEPAKPALRPKAEPQPAPRAHAPRRIIAVPPKTAPAAEDRLKVEPQPAAPPAEAAPAAAPHFDLDAARSVARQVANAPDPAKAGTALERLPPPPLQTESKLERGIKAAKRPLCKDGVPGGLLAPIFLAMDKKDGGCKW